VDKSHPDTLPALWNDIATALKAELNTDAYARWFKDIELIDLDAQRLTLRVPNNIFQLWIESNYLPLLRAAIMLVLGEPRSVQFVHADEAAPAPKGVAAMNGNCDRQLEPVAEPAAPTTTRTGTLPMNPRNTFDAFVVGANNQFAHAACLAVSEAPARAYNPLFIYGGVGLGKTHLMQAIGQHIAGKRKPARVLYISCEVFTNEFIDAIQTGTLVKFRKRYRQADVLLIDDIQFLSGKERSQEEFFHTFNTLFDGHKQIVLSSDRPPSELNGLEQRLVSRFDWGLTAELQPPDVETRVAILRKKAATMGVRVPDAVLQFIAERVRTNVRKLEGALTRVASFVSLDGGRTPLVDRLEQLLRDLLQEEARRSISVDQIQKRVAEHFDIRIADMTSKRRPANIAFPRQIAMYLTRELTKLSLSEIGDAFGGRDHGTVLHAHRLVRERSVADEKTRQVVRFLEGQLAR
jgi:chromosomal replication initiator protein